MKKEELKNRVSKIEIFIYIITGIFLSIFFEQKEAFIYLAFFILLTRATLWDYNHKLIPLYLILGIFFITFFITNKPLSQGILDGFVFIGGCFILNQVMELYQDIRKYDETNTLIGEGDILIIGAIGVLLETKVAISCIMTAVIFMVILNLFYKKKELPFLPFLAPSLIFYLIFKKEFIYLFV